MIIENKIEQTKYKKKGLNIFINISKDSFKKNNRNIKN